MTDHPSNYSKRNTMPPALVVIASWMIPGLGYWLIGQRDRALTIGTTIITLFLLGLLFAGIRVIDVPGFDRTGAEVRIDPQGRRLESNSGYTVSYNAGSWALTSRGFFGELANKPWYVAQIFTGPTCLIASRASLAAARSGVPISHARLYDIGTLYTAVAGMLNLLAIIDAGHRASNPVLDDDETQAGETVPTTTTTPAATA